MKSGGIFRVVGKHELLIAALAASTATGALIAPAAAQEAAPAGMAEQVRTFDIAPGSVADALVDFGRQSGLQVSMNSEEVRGLKAQGVKGRMTASQALTRLLASTGLVGRIDGRIVSLRRAAIAMAGEPQSPGTVTLDSLRVEGAGIDARETGTERDARGHNEVYDLDLSSTFAGREEVERYKGVNTADVLKGMVNVFSGDARNGGALDPSIRGVQGPGRVPVIIDGTEQALTVWRGYNGASNRSYIDPSLISDVQVLKGPISIRGVNGSTGGAVVLNTLDADDIIAPGRNFGIEARLEGGNNSTDPRLPTLLTGQDYRTVPGFLNGAVSPIYPYGDPSLRVNLRTRGDNDFVSFGDRAVRIAAAGRMGDFDLFGAYAFRERGNYFSGTSKPDYYQQEELPRGISDYYVQRLGLNYEPGNEVPNTSSELESVLLKATWRIADDQYLQVGFRDSKSKFGEIMPSRVISGAVDSFGNVQWPLSKVHAQAYNAEYKWQPDSRWIDIKANLWATDTVSDTYSAGGFPNSASTADPIIINSAIANGKNNRVGISGSNRFSPTSKLDFLLEGSWQHEKLRSDDEYAPTPATGFRQFPRAGRREEHRITLSGEWRATPHLKLNAGLTYSGYWAKDDFLPRLLEYHGGSVDTYVVPHYEVSYRTSLSGQAAYAAYEAYYRDLFTQAGRPPAQVETLVARRMASYLANPTPFIETHTSLWEPGADGRFRRADNACLNGSLDNIANYVADSCSARGITEIVPVTAATRKSGHGWAPTVSATVYFSGSSRAYLRYAKAYRFPSMFESTVGFSASLNPLNQLKPERVYSWEGAFIQDLRQLFALTGDDQYADLKLTWYHNTTRDVIERDPQLMFTNLDKHTVAGLELQARFDNGAFFASLGAGHMTKNVACDESVAARMDPTYGRMPNCMKYGFLAGYLLTQAVPEDSANLSVGGRFFDRRLEVGGRLVWYGKYDNPELAKYSDREAGCIGPCALNIPFSWGEVITFDAHAKFRINDHFTAELAGLNLNNRYYLDPLARSLLPAPGRSVRLSLTGRF